MNEFQRKMKKFIIVMIILVFVGSIVFILTLPEKDPCTNGALDVGEVGVDCGGFCAAACELPDRPSGVEDIKVNWYKSVEDGRNAYDFVASLSNENESWGVSHVVYEFVYFDADGNKLGSRKGVTALMPKGAEAENSQRYIIEQNVSSNVAPAKIEFKLSDFVWEEVKGAIDVANLNENVVRIANKDFSVDKNLKYYLASGVTKNTSKYDFVRVDIEVVVYGKDNEVLSARKTNQLTVVAGDGWGFSVPFPNLKVADADISWVDYRTTTNVFDQNNFMKEYRSQR